MSYETREVFGVIYMFIMTTLFGFAVHYNNQKHTNDNNETIEYTDCDGNVLARTDSTERSATLENLEYTK